MVGVSGGGGYVGYSYPRWLDRALIQKLWKRWCCKMGWHLWDEIWSPDGHWLFCDACEDEIRIHSTLPRGSAKP